MKNRKGREVVKTTLNFFVDYTVKHFTSEEELMKKNNYPDFVNHKTVHDKFVTGVINMKAKYLSGKLLPMDLSSSLSDWLRNHIPGTDKKYIPYLKN